MSVLADVKKLEKQALARLAELRPLVDEYEELSRLAHRMGWGEGGERDGRHSGASSTKDGSHGATLSVERSRRAQDVMRIVRAQPGVTVAEVGHELGVDPTGLYRVVRALVADGTLVKSGTQLHLAGDPSPRH